MYRSITLPNGARILTQRIPGVRSAALGFFLAEPVWRWVVSIS